MSVNAFFRATITQAFADTVVDDSRAERGAARVSRHDLSVLPKVGDLVGAHYRLTRLLGQGMFGKVYVAERVDVPEHRVALKLMPSEVYAGRNVQRELVMLAAAGHPNIVQLKDHGTTEKYVWLTMPVYEGETLAARLERGPLGLKEAYQIFLPIARGVEALHRAGLRHQDLKPENIFLARFAGRLHPIILDLGVAAECSSTFVAGTILYAAPEQMAALSEKGESTKVSESIDTYGLASTLLLSLVGPDMFPGWNAHTREEMAEAQKEREEDPIRAQALPHLQGEPRQLLSDALRHWLAGNSSARPSVREMAEQLDVLLEQERQQAASESRQQAKQVAMLRHARMAVAGLLAGALALLGYAYSKRSTLRLANELARVRAEGAAQFDKLETCAASHRIAQHEATECRSLRARDQNDLKRTLEGLSHTDSAAQAECAKQIMTYSGRLKTCEDTVLASGRTCSTQKEQIAAEWTARAGQLAAELADQKKQAETKAAENSQLTAQVEKAREDLRTCVARQSDNPYSDPAAAQPPGVVPAVVQPVARPPVAMPSSPPPVASLPPLPATPTPVGSTPP